MKKTIQHYREKVEKKLVIRQRIFFVIIAILVGVSIYDLYEDRIVLWLALNGFILSTLVGVLLSRMFRVFWNQEKGKVVTQLDTLGIILLIAYIGIEISRKWIIGHWFVGTELNALSLIVLTGLLFGRFLGTIFSVRRVLIQNG